LTPPHYTNSQNLNISFGYVDSWAKIFQILYTLLENSTTHNGETESGIASNTIFQTE
jgi:hypothetical protein